MAETARLFIGIELDDAWSDGLSAVADEIRAVVGDAGRWVQPSLYHVTVVFLGEQSAKNTELSIQALRTAAESSPPFTLHLTEVQRLGGHEHGALVAGVADPSGGLLRLRAWLNDELRFHKIKYDSKPLVPHITLARPRRRAAPLSLTPYDLGEAPPLRVRTVSMIKSLLLPAGPKYLSLMKIGLEGQ